MNIVTNASEALDGEAGEIAVVMRSDRSFGRSGQCRTFDGDGPPAERYVVLTVRDTGHGMDSGDVVEDF